jgi:hypothetical protein
VRKAWANKDCRIEKWQDDLKVFGYTNGISLNDECNEVKCQEEIVEAICK